ncbi:MAG: transposase [Lysobacteraceae bacterium SCN 69-123]|nr:MAG: transposase [Xanthomonadaceae bacterium SCN 69-123]
MARSGLYKSDVQRARDGLLAQGQHPSVDAVRVALGNTGSKTTIHRYLKELEEEDGQGVGAKVAVSEALQDLVGRLAARLHEEAEAAIAEARERFQAQLQERETALEASRQEAAALSTQLQRTEIALQAETEAHAQARQTLTEANTTVRQLEERIAGLTTRVAEHEAQTSVKDQREQEQRRHEQQLQELQVALRQANEALTGKNHELLQLNRDNGRLLELNGRLDKDLRQVRADAQDQQQELDALRLMAAEHTALQDRWAHDTRRLDALQVELTSASEALAQERGQRQQAETEALTLRARLEATEAVFARLRPRGDATMAADAE